MSAGDAVLKYWPIIVVGAGVLLSAGADTFRLSAQAEDIQDLSKSVDENEDTIESIQRLLIQRQGEVELDLQRIEGATRGLQIQQEKQGEDLEEILRLLREQSR